MPKRCRLILAACRNCRAQIEKQLPTVLSRDKSTLTLGVRLRTNSGVTCLETAARPDLVQMGTVLSAVLLRDLDHPAAPLSATSASVIARAPRTPFAHRTVYHYGKRMRLALRSDRSGRFSQRKDKMVPGRFTR